MAPLYWKRALMGKVVDAPDESGATPLEEFSVLTQESVSPVPPSRMRTSDRQPSNAPVVDKVIAVVADTVMLLIRLAAARMVTAPAETVGVAT